MCKFITTVRCDRQKYDNGTISPKDSRQHVGKTGSLAGDFKVICCASRSCTIFRQFGLEHLVYQQPAIKQIAEDMCSLSPVKLHGAVSSWTARKKNNLAEAMWRGQAYTSGSDRSGRLPGTFSSTPQPWFTHRDYPATVTFTKCLLVLSGKPVRRGFGFIYQPSALWPCGACGLGVIFYITSA